MSRSRFIVALPLLLMLSACHLVVLDPAGDVAAQQRDLLIDSTLLMLIIIVPVMVMTALFAWKYRQSNREARYDPEWDNSIHLELAIWSAPLLIIIGLGALTWVGTHLLDPYRPLGRIREGQPVTETSRPLEVDVVALDWKWLFIYPQYGLATVNEFVAPVDRPIDFRITSESVMNSFYIPALAGQVYAMPGMHSELHAVANVPGEYQGFSANYSGAGFSGMHFSFRAVTASDFDPWVARIKGGGGMLTRDEYLKLARPSVDVPPGGFAQIDPGLFDLILQRCVQPGKACEGGMMAAHALPDQE